jgi:hypothetical protein
LGDADVGDITGPYFHVSNIIDCLAAIIYCSMLL